MEIGQLQCDNLGMTRDTNISAVGRDKEGVSTYAFENHNIRVLAVNDNTKYVVTNEKSTRYEGYIYGTFLGACVLNNYLVLFVKNTKLSSESQDSIYRIEYKNNEVFIKELFTGNLNFDLNHPIEALGYYESEEVQKVYWVDGLNQNRFINIVEGSLIFKALKVTNGGLPGTLQYELKFIGNEYDYRGTTLYSYNLFLGQLRLLLYGEKKVLNGPLFTESILEDASSLALNFEDIAEYCNALQSSFGGHDYYILNSYDNFQFDFLGRIRLLPTISIKKNYEKAGTFQAGTIQYFITYYNKYGVETCIVWNSDLLYISQPSRGAKADEAVSCSFDFEISNIDSSYDFLRIYSCYRSGINGIVSSRIVADISLANYSSASTFKFTDSGAEGLSIAAGDMQYIGGQKIVANTLDYKQDTLFLGDIKANDNIVSLPINKIDTYITDLGVTIKEAPGLYWGYKYIGSIPSEGVYDYTPEIKDSQKNIAGFKWREIYRFGIQLMSYEGEWTSVIWIGDKYCNLKPQIFTESNHQGYEVDFVGDGNYIAEIRVNEETLFNGLEDIKNKYLSYRLLVAETNLTNRRIIQLGVINPTMFNYYDRYYNKPFAFPSWIFRPRNSAITNRHYDTLPLQSEETAELQGIVERLVPGFKESGFNNPKYNSYIFIIASNAAADKANTGFIQWKLIYFNSGLTAEERAKRMYLALYTGKFPADLQNADHSEEYTKVAELIKELGISKLQKNIATDPSSHIIPIVETTTEEEIISKLQEGYFPINIFGTDYKVISSRCEKETTKNWWTVTNFTELKTLLDSEIREDMTSTEEEEVGEELAGKIVLNSVMLPDSEELKQIGGAGSDATEIGTAILAAVATAAAVVLSALSGGSLTAPAAIMATSACSAAAAVCAIAAGAATATFDLERDKVSELCATMAAKGYMPIGTEGTGLASRLMRSKSIGFLLTKFFEPLEFVSNGGLYPNLSVPILKDDYIADGKYPFRTGHPYTEKGCIGEDYNAFVKAGILTNLEDFESDLRKKQNLFCVDESIVTLNSPDVEEVFHALNNSLAYELNLVGYIPIDSAYGMYNLEVEAGLNSNSMVLLGRYRTCNIGEVSSNINGLLNADIYLDFKANEYSFEDELIDNYSVVVSEDVGLYRLFMWHRDTAGFAFPKVTITDSFGNTILENKSKVVNKIFANIKYSRNSCFEEPFRINIEEPVVCLDSLQMLKPFNYDEGTKNYYENIDTLSINTKNYPLTVDSLSYPSTQNRINNVGLKDPIHIRFRETPHILIPFKWHKESGTAKSATLLPSTSIEGLITPNLLYGEDGLNGIELYGTKSNVSDADSYILLETNSETLGGDWWEVGIDARLIITNVKLGLLETKAPDFDSEKNTKYLLIVRLVASQGALPQDHYYDISLRLNKTVTSLTLSNWTSLKINTLPVNSRIRIKEEDGSYSDHYTTVEDLPSSHIRTILSDNYEYNTWFLGNTYWNIKGTVPYLFLGELVKKEFNYNDWNGGTTDNALQQLNWNVASEVTSVTSNINRTWGDTFYQRWDCQKTYPYTEEDINSNVEVLSFMLETHYNLDGRCDLHRGIDNLVTLRPSNTIYNRAYDLSDNFFSYKVLDNKFEKKHFEADVIWSLTKNNMEDIDKWTNLVASNEMSLDGRFGTIRKILNVNDILISFLDTGISAIKYNELTALNASSGLPVQLGNSGKVDGYRVISDTIGCHNKFSINKNSSGVYFADDFNKSFNRFTINEGIRDLGTLAELSLWFKRNLNGHLWEAINRDNFRTSYDEKTHDLYIIRNNECLVYNSLLNRFVSFMDYHDTPLITRLQANNGLVDTFSVRLSKYMDSLGTSDVIEIWKLYAGVQLDLTTDYNVHYHSSYYGYIYGSFKPYSIEYRVTPDPIHDSIFTNYCYTSDWINPSKDVKDTEQFESIYTSYNDPKRRYTTFDLVEAKNEYQYGIIDVTTSLLEGLSKRRGIWPLKSKFRIWRGNIPRDGYTTDRIVLKGDRMRNPWIHLKFIKNEEDDSKMIFHNLTVTYYNQYGRF